MSERPVFVGTNVLVYPRDSRDPERQRQAAEWAAHLWELGLGRLSVQVLHEYYVTVTAKLDPGLPVEEAREDVLALRAWSPLPMTVKLTAGALEEQARWGYSFWESLIVAAARAQGCSRILTEDLSHGQDLDGVRVVSPFLERP